MTRLSLFKPEETDGTNNTTMMVLIIISVNSVNVCFSCSPANLNFNLIIKTCTSFILLSNATLNWWEVCRWGIPLFEINRLFKRKPLNNDVLFAVQCINGGRVRFGCYFTQYQRCHPNYLKFSFSYNVLLIKFSKAYIYIIFSS